MDINKAKRRSTANAIGCELKPYNIDTIIFLYHGCVSAEKLQRDGSKLFLELSLDQNYERVIECLARAGRKDLASKYSEACSNDGENLYSGVMKDIDDLGKTRLDEFRVVLVCIANELTDEEDLIILKDITHDDVPKRSLEKAKTVLDFFSLLMEEKILHPHTLDTALLDPMEHRGITAWKKHNGKISGFKERLAVSTAGEKKESKVNETTETGPEVAAEQTSVSNTDSLGEVQETTQKLPEGDQSSEEAQETQTKGKEVEPKQANEHPQNPNEAQEIVPNLTGNDQPLEQETEGAQGGAEEDPSQTSRKCVERQDTPQGAENEDSNSTGEDKEKQPQKPKTRRNATAADQPQIDEGRNQTSIPDTDSGGAKPKRRSTHNRVDNDDSGEYRMTSIPRGTAVIFNIEKFNRSQSHPPDIKIEDRTGSSVDADGIQRIFRKLHFIVERHDDCSIDTINDRLRDLASDTDHENADCIAIFILTHGKNGKLLDTNCVEFDFVPLRKYFKATDCKTLAGKPKMFFIQACQGSEPQGRYLKKDVVVIEDPSPPAPPVTSSPSSMSRSSLTTPSVPPPPPPPPPPTPPPPSLPLIQGFRASGGEQSPDEADFLVCCPTPGYVSYRHTECGSWFISAFLDTLERDCNSDHLLDILVTTNRILGNKTGNIQGTPCAQILDVNNSLRRKVFLRTNIDS